MSGGIQINGDLINDVKAAVMKHDASAGNDLVAMQYLTAIAGYILAHQDNQGLDKRGLLSDLATFMEQVLEQVEADLLRQPPSQDAFGVWRPGDQ